MLRNGFAYEYGKFTLTQRPVNSFGDAVGNSSQFIINPGMGTVLKLFAHDFDLPMDLGESVVANLNMTVSINVTALHNEAFPIVVADNRTYEFVVITSNKQTLAASYLGTSDQAVMITKDQLMNASIESKPMQESKQLTGGKRLGGKSSGGKEITLKGLENML
jgi:hypothetical protein